MKESTIIRKVAMGELPATAIDLVAAVMKHIQCGCGDEVLNVRSTVLAVTSSGGQHVMAGQCWDRIKEQFESIMARRDLTFEVIDGRLIQWGK